MRLNMPEFDDKYSSCKRTYTTLRIYPGGISPEDITKRLKIEPTSMQHNGDLVGKTKQRVIKLDGWFLTTKGKIKSADSRRHIDWILEKIKDKKRVLRQLQSEGVDMDICCFWESRSGNGGPTISPPQMARLSKLNIEVWWDVYFFGFAE
jgi:hypothetical protein